MAQYKRGNKEADKTKTLERETHPVTEKKIVRVRSGQAGPSLRIRSSSVSGLPQLRPLITDVDGEANDQAQSPGRLRRR